MSSVNCTDLSRQFSLPGLRFEGGSGGLIRAAIQTNTASGELYLQGAHVTSWQPAGHEPVLWMSRASNFEMGKAIRGGVPICFPWFGPHPTNPSAPAHGFARISEWTLKKAQTTDDGGIELLLMTRIDPFQLSFQVEFDQTLRMSLRTELPADVAEPQRFEDALHTYLAVGDVRSIAITGLEHADYLDKVDSAARKAATGRAIEFSGETDRVYMDTKSVCIVSDRLKNRTISVQKSGSLSTVVWNPWIAKSVRMLDFGNEEWPEMVCIETANVGSNAIELLPGQLHCTAAVISVTENFG